MSDVREIPTPIITARPEGHIAVCPVCAQEFEVVTHERPDPNGAEFVVTREPPRPDGTPGKPIEVIKATITEYDLVTFESHYQESH